MSIRIFHLYRDEDVSGVSGTGKVAEGVEFTDGTVVLHWLGNTPSTNTYENIKQLETIHGHEGRTRVEFIYEERPKRVKKAKKSE